MASRHDGINDLDDYIPEHGDYKNALDLESSKPVTDQEIAALAQGDGFPMTEYQTRHFVVGDGLTPYRMRRQALLEIESRRSSLHGMLKKERKAKAEAAILEREIDNEPDILKQELMRCDLDELYYDIEIYTHKIPQARRELKEFIDHLRKLFPDGEPTVEDIKNIAKEDPEQERLYWQVRMAKQTAVDLISMGRIGAGQMGSLMLMDAEDQTVVIEKALEYSQKLENSMALIGDDTRQRLIGNKTVPMIQEEVRQQKLHAPESLDD